MAQSSSFDASEAARLPPGTSHDDVYEHLHKILASRTFSSASRSKDFLRYTVSNLLKGQANRIKEYSIAVEAFGKDESFDPRINPMIRVEAARLRAKLKTYVEREGSDDRLVIEVPKGTYIPTVRYASRGGNPPLKAGTGAARIRTVGILPFLILDYDQDAEVLGERLARRLTDELNRIPGLVVSPVFCVEYSDARNEGQTFPEAEILVEGGIHKVKQKHHVKVRLIDLITGKVRSVVVFDGTAKTLLASLEEISGTVAAVLRSLVPIHHQLDR